LTDKYYVIIEINFDIDLSFSMVSHAVHGFRNKLEGNGDLKKSIHDFVEKSIKYLEDKEIL